MPRPALRTDTHPAAEHVLVEGYRRMSSADKAKRLVELTHGAQEMALSRLRAQYPDDTARQRQLRLAALWIDDDTMRRAFGWDPEVEGR
ncbi:MAG: hypothetical protein H6739_28475 [Alphaproteobacteria bacterium]|nr:hypothetical protein [Alphaproteobacteria bacterium]